MNTIEQYPLSESIGGQLYFGTRRDCKWLICDAGEEPEERQGVLYIKSMVFRLAPLWPKRIKKYRGTKSKSFQFTDFGLPSYLIMSVEKINGGIRYRFSRGLMTVLPPTTPKIISLAA